MKPWEILVAGSSGLMGSEDVQYFDRQRHHVVGAGNNMRRVFFGPSGDTLWNLEGLKRSTGWFIPTPLDIRDRDGVTALFRVHCFDLIVHCAEQPSHDKAADIGMLDFEVNTLGTVNLLEPARQYCRDAAFVLMSSNKVYGDAPNEKALRELETRFDFAGPADFGGIDENCRIDCTLHSLFGASKVAADIYAQEYGRYFGINVGIFGGGSLVGPSNSGVELHGFLSFLVKIAISGSNCNVYGGKEVRDNLHIFDVVRAFDEIARNPRPDEVYNLGGGRDNGVSLLEAIARIEVLTWIKINLTYEEQARRGDLICHISNPAKLKSHYPGWSVTRSIDSELEEMAVGEYRRNESRSELL